MSRTLRDWGASRAILVSEFVTFPRSLLKTAPLLVGLALIIGCTAGVRSVELQEPLPVAGEGATIAVWREKQSCGSYPLNYVVVDGRPIVALAVDENTSFQVAAGEHSIAVLHSVIDMPIIVGGPRAALPVGVIYGMYGTNITDVFSAGMTYYYVLRSACFPGLDENKRVSIERVVTWPTGATPSPKNFVSPGSKTKKTDAP